MRMRNWLWSLKWMARPSRTNRKRKPCEANVAALESLEERVMLSAVSLKSLDAAKGAPAPKAAVANRVETTSAHDGTTIESTRMDKLDALAGAGQAPTAGLKIDGMPQAPADHGFEVAGHKPPTMDELLKQRSGETSGGTDAKTGQPAVSGPVDRIMGKTEAMAAELAKALEAAGMSRLAAQMGLNIGGSGNAESQSWLNSWRSEQPAPGRSLPGVQAGAVMQHDPRTAADSDKEKPKGQDGKKDGGKDAGKDASKKSTPKKAAKTTPKTKTSTSAVPQTGTSTSSKSKSKIETECTPSHAKFTDDEQNSGLSDATKEQLMKLFGGGSSNQQPNGTKERPTDDAPTSGGGQTNPLLDPPPVRKAHRRGGVADPPDVGTEVDVDVARLASAVVAYLQSTINPGPDGWDTGGGDGEPAAPRTPGVVDPPGPKGPRIPLPDVTPVLGGTPIGVGGGLTGPAGPQGV